MHAEMTHSNQTAVAAFAQQVETLVAKGYPWAAGLTDEQFRSRLAPLAAVAAALPADDDAVPHPPAAATARAADAPPRRIPFVLVVGRDLVAPARAVELLERRGRWAVTMLDAEAFDAFLPIDGEAPPAAAYLLVDVDTGHATRNDPPDRALPALRAEGRLPLTVDEGIALVTQVPEAVATNAGFSLLGSRRGDRRVSAMWVSRGQPKLGWCFAGVPHTWLGSASCARRAAL